LGSHVVGHCMQVLIIVRWAINILRQASVDVRYFVRSNIESSDNTKVAGTTLKCPEEIGVRLGVGVDYCATGQDNLKVANTMEIMTPLVIPFAPGLAKWPPLRMANWVCVAWSMRRAAETSAADAGSKTQVDWKTHVCDQVAGIR
jgi:hypothetical protein